MTTPKIPSGSRSMLRSPSHESDLSSLASGHRVTFASKCTLGTHSPSFNGDRDSRSPVPRRPLNIPEIFWLEEDGNNLLKSCGTLSDAVGIPKSFSTSDITNAITEQQNEHHHLHRYVSELALNSFQKCGFLVDYPNRLEQTSRSCSTWVAVGELASTSQLPSPHGTHSINSLQFSNNALSASNVPSHSGQSSFSSVDLIRSVNKKVRKNYIRRKILMTYRALERMSQSEFNLDRLVAAANEQLEKKRASPGPTELLVPNLNAQTVVGVAQTKEIKVDESGEEEEKKKKKSAQEVVESKPSSSTTAAVPEVVLLPEEEGPSKSTTEQRSKKFSHGGLNKNMTACDIELERGRSLTKYERNMLIFNWLHSLVMPMPLDEDPPI